MSREEAIEIFKRLKENAPNEMHLETVGTAQELFDMAIQALSQEPCEKCEVGNPCLYCKREFEPQESEDKTNAT